MIQTILDKIVVLLSEVDDIHQVSKFPILKPTGYPYAVVTFQNEVNEVLTNTQDRVHYEFLIELYQEKLEDFKGREDAESTANNRAFTIAEKFRANNDLGIAEVKRVLPLNSVKDYVDGNTRIKINIVLTVETIESITN